MGDFIDHPSKKVIREQWSKPLIKFIHDSLGYKLMYLGLPGPYALDLLNWIEYIDRVIAFQCRDYPNPSSIRQSRDDVVKLEKKLSELERERRLTTFAVYDGYIEEVVLRGRDTSGNHFSQNDIVTIYNLDFCNGIAAPLIIVDDKGSPQELYKSEAIRKLLEIQRDISSQTGSKKFVMFLTIHSNFWYQEKKRFLIQTTDPILRRYLRFIHSLTGRNKNVRLLKAYLYETIKNFFCHCDFTPEFLPVIFYKGAGKEKENWLMHFTIVGALNKQINANAPCFQKADSFLYQKFLSADNKKIDLSFTNGIKETDCLLDPVGVFQNSESYKHLWQKKRK